GRAVAVFGAAPARRRAAELVDDRRYAGGRVAHGSELFGHRPGHVEAEVNVGVLNARLEGERVLRRIGRCHVGHGEDEVATRARAVGGVGRIRARADLDQVGDAVTVGVAGGRR